jgi:multiple sugar transport system substrate-binding protein
MSEPSNDTRISRGDFLRKTGLVLGAGALTAGPASAAPGWVRARRAQGPVTITLLTPAGPRFGTAHKAVAAQFESAQSRIRVAIEDIPLNDLYIKGGAALGSNSSRFDAIILDPFFIPSVATKLTNIGALVNRDAKYNADITKAVPPKVRTYPSFRNVIYGLPTDSNCQLMWYRKDLFDKEGIKPPETYDDALEVGKHFTRDTKQGKQYGFTTNLARNPFAPITLGTIMNCNGQLWIVNGVPKLATDVGVAALEMLVALMKYADPSAVNAGDNETVQAIATGAAVCAPIAWTTNGFQNPQVNKYAKVTFAAPVPRGKGPKGKHAPWLGGLFYGIPKASKNKGAAYEFGKYLSSAQAMETFCKNTGQPARTAALKQYKNIWPYFDALGRSLPTAVPFVKEAKINELHETLGTEVFNAVNGSKSPEKAMMDADAAWRKILGVSKYD